jgi:hypothetical protein
MARPPRIPSRRLTDSVRRRLEVATAMAWEALVETHVVQATQFVLMFHDRMPLEDALARYLLETDQTDSMASAVRTRVLVALEGPMRGNVSGDGAGEADAVAGPAEADAEGWSRFRPDVVLRGMKERQRREDETELWVRLGIARAEEAVIRTHVDNAITFAALLEDEVPLDRAVQYYLGAVVLAGARGQAVLQRTMSRLADVHLPAPAQP